MASLLDAIPQTLDVEAGTMGQNKIEKAAAQARAVVTDDIMAAKKQAVTQQAQIQERAILAEDLFTRQTVKIAEDIKTEISGTKENLEAQEDLYREKMAQYTSLLQDSESYSIFSHPIKTIRGTVQRGQLKTQLNQIVEGLNAGYAHVDNEYAQGAQELRHFRDTVINLSAAELQLKANEAKKEQALAEIETAGAAAKIDQTLEASRQQKFIDDPAARAAAARKKQLEDSLQLQLMWKVKTGGLGKGFTPQIAELMAGELSNSSPEVQLAWSKAASRYATVTPVERQDGESEAAWADRSMQQILTMAGKKESADIASMLAKESGSQFSELFADGDKAIDSTLIPSERAKYLAETGLDEAGFMANAANQKALALRIQQAKAATPAVDRLMSAGQFYLEDITRTTAGANAGYSSSGMDATMAAVGVDPVTSQWFSTTAAKSAIEFPAFDGMRGIEKIDAPLSLMQALKTAPTTNGKPLSPADRANIVAKYVQEHYRNQYLATGDYRDQLTVLTKLLPEMASAKVSVPVVVKFPFVGKENYDLTNPSDLLNLEARLAKSNQARNATTKTTVPTSIPGLSVPQ